MRKYRFIISLEKCNLDFTGRNISNFVSKLCKLIKMRKHGKLMLWKDSHNQIKELRGGISAFQFLKTSSIVLHSFEKSKLCEIDIFSCKKFDYSKAEKFSEKFFNASKVKSKKIID